jgi:5-methyltetrahydrofolate--homocysteine methyltransferase
MSSARSDRARALPSLGHTTFAGPGADATASRRSACSTATSTRLLIETCQDILQTKSALCGVLSARSSREERVPILVQVTMETTGTMLVGTELGAALAALEPYPSTSSASTARPGRRRWASTSPSSARHAPTLVSCQPNAGLPQMVDGQPHYPLKPADLARLAQALRAGGRRQDRRRLLRHDARTPEGRRRRLRERSRRRSRATCLDAVGLEPVQRACTLRQDNSFLILGERTNANGSSSSRSCSSWRTSTAWSRWAASRSPRAPTSSTSAPPTSAATRSPT